MIKSTLHHIKLLLLLLHGILAKLLKFSKFLWTGKHEIERICEAPIDDYQRCTLVDLWMVNTNCRPIRRFLQDHFNDQNKDGELQKAISRVIQSYKWNEYRLPSRKRKHKLADSINNNVRLDRFDHPEQADDTLNSILKDLTDELVKLIDKTKQSHAWSLISQQKLKASIFCILSYKATLSIAEQLAQTKYDANLRTHTKKLISLWNNLIRSEARDSPKKVFPSELSEEICDESDIVSRRWSHIGFQGEDPGTDFRGMGVLGLLQLEYLSRRPKQLAADLLGRSLDEDYSYPFAIVGINITYNLLRLFRDGAMRYLYYDSGSLLLNPRRRTTKLLTNFNDLYVELFLRFDVFWRDCKPENIFEFKSIMEKFIESVKTDLGNRRFSFKFQR